MTSTLEAVTEPECCRSPRRTRYSSLGPATTGKAISWSSTTTQTLPSATPTVRAPPSPRPPTVQNGNTLLTLSQSVTVRYPGSDTVADLSQTGPITAINDTFNNTTGRRVIFRSGVGVTVQGCTFEDSTPLVIGGIDFGEGPDDAHNVTVTGNTFLHNAVCLIFADDGYPQARTGGQERHLSGNRFLDGGRGSGYNTPPLTVDNVTGVTVANNWFDDNWGVNSNSGMTPT